MKKILIPVIAVIAVLLIIATVLAQTNKGSSSDLGYHTHENGETHYDTPTEPTTHTHENGEVHYEEH